MRILTDARAAGVGALCGRFLLLVLVLAASACAGTVGSQLTVFHEWPADASSRSFRLVRTAAQADSLAHASFEKVLRAELLRGGFAESAQPRFDIGFDYQSREILVRTPDYGPYYSPYLMFGTGGPRTYFSFGVPLTWWSAERNERRFERRLSMTVTDRRASPPRRVYEGTAINDGFSPDLMAALPYLARALLKDFPGPSGRARWVEVPVDSAPRGN